MYRCCPSSLILLVMLIVGSWELVVSSVGNLIVVVILPSLVQKFSTVYPNLLRKHGWWWSMSDGWGRPSVLGEIIWILGSPVEVLHWWVFQEEYTVKKMSMVGADYIQMTIYMCCMFIFNHLTWWLEDLWDYSWIFWLCQTECQCSRIKWVVHVLCP